MWNLLEFFLRQKKRPSSESMQNPASQDITSQHDRNTSNRYGRFDVININVKQAAPRNAVSNQQTRVIDNCHVVQSSFTVGGIGCPGAQWDIGLGARGYVSNNYSSSHSPLRHTQVCIIYISTTWAMQKEKDICILNYIQTSTHSYGVCTCTCCSICMVCPQLEESMRIDKLYLVMYST